LLASANDLRGKFLIKTKRNASDPDDFKDMVEDDIAAAINSEDTAHSDEPSQTFSVGTLLKAQSGSLSSVGSKKDKDKLKPSSSSSNISTPDTKTKKTVHEVARELSELVHLGTSGFKGFDDTSKRHYDWYCWSFSEGAATSRAKTSSNYIDWNRTHMSRIYPAGNRFDSSNYNPQPFWNTGCQVVALYVL
jgi:phosphatidylinositol phospholipase C eta